MARQMIATQSQERAHALNMRRIGRPVPKDDRVAGYPDAIYDDPETPEEKAILDKRFGSP